MLPICLSILSAVFGYLLCQSEFLSAAQHPPRQGAAIGAAIGADMATAQQEGSPYEGNHYAQRWGELQAEVLRLRLLLGKIADAADLREAEFALGLELLDERYLNSIMVLEDRDRAETLRFQLAKRAVDHMTTQADLMLEISQRRQLERRFSLSGSPVAKAKITSRYGYRIDPRNGKKRRHQGVDFGGDSGSKILALADGVVTFSGKNGDYGNLIELEHTGGYRTRYAHNNKNLVDVGFKVSKGQVIARMGSTGKSTGTHVHVEVRSGKRAVDPMQFISAGS